MVNQPLSRSHRQAEAEAWATRHNIDLTGTDLRAAYEDAKSALSETAATTGDDQAAILAVLNKALYPESGCEIPDLYTAAKTIAAEYAMLQEKLNAVRSATAPLLQAIDELIEMASQESNSEAFVGRVLRRYVPELRALRGSSDRTTEKA